MIFFIMQHLPYYFVLDYGNYRTEKNNGQEGYIGRSCREGFSEEFHPVDLSILTQLL